MKKKLLNLALSLGMMSVIGSAQAALNDRGGGLLYDDVLNVTWLQDANYANTSAYVTPANRNVTTTNGRMNWEEANAWAGGLVYGGYDGWRLAANTPVGADWNYNDDAFDGSTDLGYNITSPHSELSYMYYVNLNLKGYVDPSGDYQSDAGVLRNGAFVYGGQADVDPVKNLQSDVYWSGTTYVPDIASYNAWFFYTNLGRQSYGPQNLEFYAWAVHPGDVAAPVPEPETYALLLAGLGLLGVVAKGRCRSLGAS